MHARVYPTRLRIPLSLDLLSNAPRTLTWCVCVWIEWGALPFHLQVHLLLSRWAKETLVIKQPEVASVPCSSGKAELPAGVQASLSLT